MTLVRRVCAQTDPAACDAELALNRDGWACLVARPGLNSGSQVLWEDLLTAIGHDIPLSTRGRAMNHAMSRALCWLAVSDFDHLVVASANDLNPTSLVDLCAVCSAIEVTVWLIYDVEPRDDREAAIDRLGAVDTPLEAFLEARRSAAQPQPVPTAPEPEAAPDVHFLAFLHTAEASMSKEGFAEARVRFEEGRRAMETELAILEEVTEASISEALHRVTADATRVAQALPVIRGAQAACFQSGWNVQVDVERWVLRGQAAPLTTALTDDQWQSLGRIQRPGDAATCALAILGASIEDMTSLSRADFDTDLDSVSIDSRSIHIPSPARPLLQAQDIHHALTATPEDPYLTLGTKEPDVTPKWVAGVLRRASEDTGIALRARMASWARGSNRRWTHRLGISVKELSA